MNVNIIDIILLAIVAGFAIAGVVRGFVKSIANLVKYILAFVISIKTYKSVSPVFMRIPFIADLHTDMEMPELEGTNGLFDKVKQVFAFLFESLKKGEDIDEVSRAVFNNYLADVLSEVFAFLALFIVSLLVINLIVFIIDKLCSLPVIRTANRVLGFILGAISGTLWAYIVSSVLVNFILPMLVSKYPDTFTLAMGETPVVDFFMNNNPVALLLKSVELFGRVIPSAETTATEEALIRFIR